MRPRHRDGQVATARRGPRCRRDRSATAAEVWPARPRAVRHPVPQRTQRRQVPSCPSSRRQHMGSLRAQPRHTTAYGFALGYRHNRSNGGIRASLVENGSGRPPGPCPIPLSAGDDGPGRGIGSRSRQQGRPAVVHGELIPALARTHIQVGSPRQQIPVGCGARIQPRSPTVSGEQLMSATQQLDLAVIHCCPSSAS